MKSLIPEKNVKSYWKSINFFLNSINHLNILYIYIFIFTVENILKCNKFVIEECEVLNNT